MNGKIKGFDGLRGLSVILVIMSHGVIWPRIGITNPGLLSVFSAHVGVSVFFALSGFLITMLLLKERFATGTISLTGFFMRRTLRIFPLYFLAITLLLIFNAFGLAKIKTCAFAFAYTYTQNFSTPSCSFSSMSHFWSLAVEEHFYLVWPLIFLAGRYFALVAALVFASACVMFGPYVLSEFAASDSWRWSFPAAAPIAFGCITAFVSQKRILLNVFSDEKSSSVILMTVLAGLASPAFYNSDLVWMLSVSGLILYVFHNQDSMLVKALEFKPLAIVGVISYGLYVWQGFFTGNGPYRIGEQFPPSLDTGLWITFVMAPLSYLFFEQPILKLKSRFSWRSKKALAEAVPV